MSEHQPSREVILNCAAINQMHYCIVAEVKRRDLENDGAYQEYEQLVEHYWCLHKELERMLDYPPNRMMQDRLLANIIGPYQTKVIAAQHKLFVSLADT